MKEVLNTLPNNVLVWLLVVALGIISWFIDKLVKNLNTELKKQFDKIDNELSSINSKIDIVNKKLDQNTMGNKASLYYNIDQILTHAELFTVWSSQLKETYEKMYNSYIELGDGLDNGKTFEIRANNIEVNDTKFHEIISKYNTNRRKLFLDHLDKMESMF